MSKFKVGDKLVALESVKTVRHCIPQQQLDILPGVVAEVKEVRGVASFSVVFDGYSGAFECGWWFNAGHSAHFVKIPSPGDVVTELVIPEGKSLRNINLDDKPSNPVGKVVRSTNPRNNHPWAPQDVHLRNDYFWPVSWLRFKYQDEQDATSAGKSFSDLKPGDKVKWVGNEDTRANGYSGISAETMREVEAQPYLTLEDGVKFKYADGGDWWLFQKSDYGTLYVDYVEPTEAVEPATRSKAVTCEEWQNKVKLTKQQKSAKRLSKYIHKAQIESRVLRELSPGGSIGDNNITDFVCKLHRPKRTARNIVETLGLELEDWERHC